MPESDYSKCVRRMARRYEREGLSKAEARKLAHQFAKALHMVAAS